MNIFAYVHQSKKWIKKNRLHKYIQHNGIVDIIKIWILVLTLLFVIVIYLYYVTLASTRWYFLRKANQENKKIQFEYEILKTDLLEYKQKNRENIHNNRHPNKIIRIQIPETKK